MKKTRVALFSLRFFFYFSVIILIPLHPGVSVSFDSVGVTQWFIIIPLMAIIAFLPNGKPFADKLMFSLRSRYVSAAALLLLLSARAGGFSLGALPPLLAGLLSFVITYLLFHYPRWAKAAVLEPFFLAWTALRLLSLSRSGEEIAGQSAVLTQFILVWTIVVFLFHGVVVYLCLYPKSARGALKEGSVFFLSAAAVLFLVIAVLPSDFIRNTIVENLLQEQMPEKIGDSSRGIEKDFDRRMEGRRTLPRGEGRQPGLRGISEGNWQNRTDRRGRGNGEGDPDNKQYMVMVVASDRDPVYMGDSIRGQLDPVDGFSADFDEPFNRLSGTRFFVTWHSHEREFDIGRKQQEVFALSTLPQKYMPWRPVSIDPVILSEDSGPLRYIHQVVSNTHLGDPLLLVNEPSRSFDSYEEYELASYFELPLEKDDFEIFNGWLNNAFENWNKNREAIIQSDSYLWELFSGRGGNLQPVNEYLEKILAILTGFAEYQYNLSYNDDGSIASLKEFLFDAMEGDCVEFSNTLALLGRIAGIPSRVVTGYLAAEGLQTEAHLRGIAELRKNIPVLRQFPFSDLFLVTNLHSHSWTQFYIPDYGWLDFESTSFSIPPVGMGDFNTWDVIIPIIDDNRVFSNIRKFPWAAVLKTAAFLAVLALMLAYVLRYGREFALFIGARERGREGARSLYLLLLARLAADGMPIKPAAKTAHEYAELFKTKPGDDGENTRFYAFALAYSELRWREFTVPSEKEERFQLLKKEYQEILKSTRRPGFLHLIKRIFSLRGLAYL